MKHAKTIFFGILLLILTVGYFNFFVCNGGEPEQTVVVDDWSKELIDGGYKPATVTKPEYIHGDDLPEAVESVLYAEGTVADSVAVEISVLETPEGTVWVKARVDGETVKWRKVQYANQPKPVHDNDWSLVAAGEWIDGVDAGVGLAWEPLTIQGARVGLQAICDLNPTLTDAPDWGSLSVRISRRIGAFSVGGYGGYRLGEAQGFAAGVSAGISLGI